jgi:hypothetical protein
MGGRTGGDRGAAPHMYYYPLECLHLLEIKEEEEQPAKEEEKDDDEKENKPTP